MANMSAMSRRGFLAAGGSLAVSTLVAGEEPTSKPDSAAKLIVSEPMLQNPAPTSMGVAFAVSAMANGFVEVSERADMKDARKVKCGGFRVTDMNDKVMLVRLTGLKPATRYHYRIGADRIHYGGGYKMRVTGTELNERVYSFVTSGEKAKSAFAVINDTHCSWKAFEKALDKVGELGSPVLLWNGDASNTQETIESQIKMFLDPPIARKDYAAGRGVLFCPGNHDSRGLANRHIERVFMFRQPEERSSRDWDLGRNFAFRQGDIAMIGLDTAEDKLDSRDVFAGLFTSEPYREAQAKWLADALERPEIKSAPFIVAFCHIPLYDPTPRANPGDLRPNDRAPGYDGDFAAWQRTCAKLWGPLLNRARVQLLVTAHQHCFRHYKASGDRRWDEIVGGGPRLAKSESATVIEGEVRNGRLVVRVHDLFTRALAGEFVYAPRA